MDKLDKQKIKAWEKEKKPQISLSGDIYSQLKPFRLPIVLVILIMMFGTLGYVWIEDYSLNDAIFQSGYTFTTTGFGALKESEFSPLGQQFTVALMLFGLLTVTFSIGVVIEVINKGDLRRLLKERKMLYKIARLKNHFVICYHNEYTIQLARQFRDSHIPFVVIDPSENLEELAMKYGYPYFIKDEPHTELALLKSYMSSAKGVITLSNNIADNIAQIASVRLFEKEIGRKAYHIIANAETLNDIEKLKKLGADSVVSPTKLMAQRVSAMAIRPEMENILESFLYKKDTPIDIEEIGVPRESWLILKKLKETHLREVANVSVIGVIQRDGKLIPMPKGDTIITVESRLLVVGTSKDIIKAKKMIRMKEKPEELKYV